MIVSPGKLVYYHGSLTNYHGYAIVEGTHTPFMPLNKGDDVRYFLRYGPNVGDYLTNVRRESFTRVNKAGFKK